MFRRHAHIVEIELRRIGGRHIIFFFMGTALKPLCAVLNDKTGVFGFTVGRVPVMA
jgi:hypothetical protein